MRIAAIFGPSIQLTAPSGKRRPIWIQAATTGTWKGHPAHPIIEFTEKTFDQVIANFRKNPSFALDANGVGNAPVVRLDYEHASEFGDPTRGSIPTDGLPAPGWVLDLEKRRGADGKVQLWALVEMGEQLWGQVERREYLWTSVAVDPNGKDRVTNQPIGAVMTSLAMTNNPFILGMEPMTTSQGQSSKKIAASASIMIVSDAERSVVVQEAPDIDQELAGYAGLNRTEKAISLLSQHLPCFRSRPWGEQVFMAGEYLAGRVAI